MDNAINTATAQTCPTPSKAAAIPGAGVISVLIVEDQPLTLVGIKLSLAEIPGFQLIGEATSGPDAVSEALRLTPNVILMDIELPRMDGIEAAKAIKKLLPKTRIIMFTSHTSPSLFSRP
jgi:DNA-binding NarL/FixJ family response regulator